MNRIALILIAVGGVLVFIGGQEWYVSRGTSGEPVAVDLADLEKGNAPPSNFIRLGPHLAIYPGAVYAFSTSKYSQSKEATPDTSINYCYYPVISASHPFMQELKALADKFGGLNRVPDNAPEPQIGSFRVLVKSKKYGRVRDIPQDVADRPGVQGLLINQISSLSNDEEKLIKQGFPQLKTDQVLILEEDRQPASMTKLLGMVGGGLAMVVVGLGMFFVFMKR